MRSGRFRRRSRSSYLPSINWMVRFGSNTQAILGDLVRGDLRDSTKYRNRSVAEILAQTLPVTMTLGALAFALAVAGGTFLGVAAAAGHGTWKDTLAMLLALAAISLPAFIIGPVLS